MATITSGLLGGLLGAIVMGAANTVLSEDPPPTAVVWAMYLGDGDPTNYTMHGTAVHLVYGAIAGVTFVAAAGASAAGLSSPGGALLWAIGWSAVLAIVAAGFWLKVAIGEEPTGQILAVTSGLHLVYGVVLGLFVYYVPAI